VKITSLDFEIESYIEVRQCSFEGPVCRYIIQAALETTIWPVLKPEFCTRENGVTMGERSEQKRGTTKFKHGCSMIA
jgi:hypothetical protein